MSKKKVMPFAPRLLNPYMVGIYLGVNGVRDFYLLVDGPDCSYMKTQYIAKNQDLYANLTNLSGFHRITNTALHPVMMAQSREEKIKNQLLKIANSEITTAIGITPMPMAAVTAIDYKRILREVEMESGKMCFEFRNCSLSGDWLDGYFEFNKVLARDIRFKKTQKKRRSVAIVGYLYDRNEYDNIGNLNELKRIFNAIGVEIVSIWLSGGNLSDLIDVSRCELILSLGYADEAAEILSERLNIPVVKALYPLGFEQTTSLIEAVAEFFGIESASRFIERETSQIVRRLEPLIDLYFNRLRIGYCGDPILFNPLREALELLGARFEYAVFVNTSDKSRFLKPFAQKVIIEPTMSDIIDIGVDASRRDDIDLFIGNSDMSIYFIGRGKAVVEIGFPSYFSHSISEEPYLGYRGFLNLVSRIIRELRYAEVREVFRTEKEK